MTTTKRPAAPPPLPQRMQAELFPSGVPGPGRGIRVDWNDKRLRRWAGVLAASAVMVASGLGMNAINVACQCQVFP